MFSNGNNLYPGYEFPDDMYDMSKHERLHTPGTMSSTMGRSNLDLSGLNFEDLLSRHRDSLASQCSEDSAVSSSTEKSRSDYLCEDESDNMHKLSEMLVDNRWKHMGHPVVYYYSDDLKIFYKVQVTSSKGKIIRAQFLKQRKKTARHQQQRRNSGQMEFHHDRPSELAAVSSGDIPLSKVYKVTTFYASWKNFSKFHRCITHVQPAQHSEVEGLKEKFFTQYKFVNASEEDQKTVEAEFSHH